MTNIEQSSTTYIYPSSYRLVMNQQERLTEKRRLNEELIRRLHREAIKDLVGAPN